MPAKAIKVDPVEIKPPTPLAKRFIRAVVGFGVGVGLGVAPFLGNLDIPGFSPLLSLFPESLQKFLVPTSAFLMGFIAAGTQFYSGFGLPISASKRYARYALAVILSSLFALMFIHRRFIETVHFSPLRVASYVIGSKRTEYCPCKKEMTDADCIRTRDANPDNIEGCWEKKEVVSRELYLSVTYLLLTGSFAYFIGLVLIRETATSKRSSSTPRQPKAKGKNIPND